MDARSSTAAESTDRALVVTRVFDAPRDLVWKALTEPERLEHWWGPKGFTSRVHKLELRPGGTFLYSQRNAEGIELWGKWVYREIDRTESAGNRLFVYRREGQFSAQPISTELAARDADRIDIY